MSAVQQITALAQEIGKDIKSLMANQGSLSLLTTQKKDSLVNAINELHTLITAATQINDQASSADTTYSSDKILAMFTQFKNDLLNGAGTAYDTLGELQALFEANDGAMGGLLAAVGNRVAYDQPQALTTPQQTQARANIGAASAADLQALSSALGDMNRDFVTDYITARG